MWFAKEEESLHQSYSPEYQDYSEIDADSIVRQDLEMYVDKSIECWRDGEWKQKQR